MLDHVDFAPATFTGRNDVAPIPSAFTAETLIATPRGEIAAGDLTIGDRVLTRDNGMQTIRDVSRLTVSACEMTAMPQLGAVRISKGALGHGLPEKDMTVSPQQRLLIVNDDAFALFEEREVLIAARDLVGRPGIAWAAPDAIEYISVVFDAHEVILSNGAWSESLDPAEVMGADRTPARRKLETREANMLAA